MRQKYLAPRATRWSVAGPMTSGLWLPEATDVCRRLHLTARAEMPPFRSSGGDKTDSAVRNIRAPCQKYLCWRRCHEPCGTQRPLLAPVSRRSTPPMIRYPSAVPWLHRQPQRPRLGALIGGWPAARPQPQIWIYSVHCEFINRSYVTTKVSDSASEGCGLAAVHGGQVVAPQPGRAPPPLRH